MHFDIKRSSLFVSEVHQNGASLTVSDVTFTGLPANSVTLITFTVEVIEMPEAGYVPNTEILRLPPGNENNFPPNTPEEIPSNEVEVPVIEEEEYNDLFDNKL